MLNRTLLIALITPLFYACTSTSPDDLTQELTTGATVKYTTNVRPIIQSQCISCHNTQNASGGLILETYAQVRASASTGSLIDRITRPANDGLVMPQNGRMPQATINVILQWRTDGFLEN